MIRAFKHKGLKKLFETGDHRGIPSQHAPKISRQLDALNAAMVVSDMNLPGYGLHELKGDRKGTWGITASANWRITFKFREGDAYAVDFEDYH